MHNYNIYIKETEYFDVVTVELLDNREEALAQLKNSNLKAMKKAVPIDTVVNSNSFDIEKEACKLLRMHARKGESFKIDCDFRNKKYVFSQEELVNNVLKRVSQDFNLVLNEPNWVVEIEEVGPYTGISVLKPHQIIKNEEKL
jgi:tRNA acetyltransferase TAN1